MLDFFQDSDSDYVPESCDMPSDSDASLEFPLLNQQRIKIKGEKYLNLKGILFMHTHTQHDMRALTHT